MLNRFSVRSRCGLEWNLASAGQIVARFQAHDALRTLLLSGVNFHQIFAQSPFANNTLDFIALWILDEMRAPHFAPLLLKPHKPTGNTLAARRLFRLAADPL